jgi:hypothetical protein
MTSTTDERPAAASATSKGTGGKDGSVPAARQAFETARDRTAAAYAAARERAGSAYESAGRRAGDSVDSYPVAALAGGLALGALVAALLPRTRREDELLGDVGRRINEGARDAAQAAKEAGRGQLDELGLSREGLQGKLNEFTDRAVGAVKSSARGKDKA